MGQSLWLWSETYDILPISKIHGNFIVSYAHWIWTIWNGKWTAGCFGRWNEQSSPFTKCFNKKRSLGHIEGGWIQLHGQPWTTMIKQDQLHGQHNQTKWSTIGLFMFNHGWTWLIIWFNMVDPWWKHGWIMVKHAWILVHRSRP